MLFIYLSRIRLCWKSENTSSQNSVSWIINRLFTYTDQKHRRHKCHWYRFTDTFCEHRKYRYFWKCRMHWYFVSVSPITIERYHFSYRYRYRCLWYHWYRIPEYSCIANHYIYYVYSSYWTVTYRGFFPGLIKNLFQVFCQFKHTTNDMAK